MKKYLLLGILSFASLHSLHAQVSKTTTVLPRLVGVTALYCQDPLYIPLDSAAYTYSGTRGGDLTHTLNYDQYSAYSYDNITGIYTGGSAQVQTFDVNNNIITNTTLNSAASGGACTNIKDSNSYNTNNDQIAAIVMSYDTTTASWINFSEHIRTFDGSHNMLSDVYSTWLSGAWVNVSGDIYTYDAANNRLTDLQQTWSAGAWVNTYNNTFTYTATNKVAIATRLYWIAATATWLNFSQTVYNYNTSDAIATQTNYYNDATTSTWTLSDRNTYNYDGTGNMTTVLTEGYEALDSSWSPEYRTMYSSFTSGQPQQVIYQNIDITGDTLVNTTKDSLTYNTYGQKTARYTTSWYLGSWQTLEGETGDRYCYDDYTTTVQNVSNTNCTTTVYPVPAKDMLHVSITWNEPQAFTIQIMDMSGRTVSQWQMPEAKSYDGNITISNLPPGNYILQMTGAYARSVKQIIVAK